MRKMKERQKRSHTHTHTQQNYRQIKGNQCLKIQQASIYVIVHQYMLTIVLQKTDFKSLFGLFPDTEGKNLKSMDPVSWRCLPSRGPKPINKVCVWCAGHRWGLWDTCCGGVGTAVALYLPAVAHLPKVLTLIAASSFIAFRTVI